MKDYPVENVRTVALAGHGTSGKTTLADALLLNMKSISRMGNVENGSSTMDYTQAEHKRQISLQLGTGYGEWRDSRIFIIDAPGYDDFIGEACSALHVADSVVLVVNAVEGIESGTERIFEMARDKDQPTLICVNMMDKENASFEKVMNQAREILSEKAVPLQLPIGEGANYKGLVDLFKMKAYMYGESGGPKEEDIPADMQGTAETAREALIEAVAEFDDAVIEKYLEGETLSPEEILSALKLGVSKGGVYPLVVASGLKNHGVRRLLDTIVVACPSPADRPPVTATANDNEVEITADPSGITAALVFKTVIEPHLGELSLIRVFSGTIKSASDAYNTTRSSSEKMGQLYLLQGKERTEVAKLGPGDIGAAVKLKDTHSGDTLSERGKDLTLPAIEYPDPVAAEAVVPAKKGEEDKMGMALHKIMEEDPTVRLEVDPELHQHVLRAMGELHLEVILEKLRERNVQVELKKPRIHYRETIKKSAEGQGRYKKQSGGRGQYGDVWMRIEPTGAGTGFEFVNKIVGGVVPGKFIPAVEKGVVEAMTEGTVAGYPVVDLRATIYDGSHHAVDSSEMAFKVAGSMAFKKVMEQAGPVLLEPIVELEVVVPDDYTGDVMGDLSSRRGRILGMTPQGRGQVVRAHVPESELYKYSAQLRSFTQGRGRFKMTFHSHEEVPRDQAERVIEAARAAKEESEN